MTAPLAGASICREMSGRECVAAGEHRNLAHMCRAAATEPAATACDEPSSHLGLSFAGIHFRFEGSAEALRALKSVPLALELGALPRLSAEVGGFSAHRAPAVAEVTCVLRSARQVSGSRASEAALGPRGIAWRWSGSEGHALTRHAEVRWRQGAGSSLAAEASLSVSPRAAESLLMALSSALLHRAGGAVLHAASVELEAGVVAFVGPSGAGKSTACEHVLGARQFSLDRLAVAPLVLRDGQRAGWVAHPLPGGTRSERGLPDAVSLGRPLRAILAVRKAAQGCELEPCADGQAVAVLRAAAFHGHRQPEAELELLGHLERLAGELPVANLHLSLGTSLAPLLSRWLFDAESWRGRRDELGEQRERPDLGA